VDDGNRLVGFGYFSGGINRDGPEKRALGAGNVGVELSCFSGDETNDSGFQCCGVNARPAHPAQNVRTLTENQKQLF
jgi:hypothetical protein